MKRPDLSSAVERVAKVAGDSRVIRAAKIAGAGVAAVWMLFRVRKELYGPGGTKLSRRRRKAK